MKKILMTAAVTLAALTGLSAERRMVWTRPFQLHVRDGLVEDSPLVGGWDSSVSKKDAYESLMKG